MGNRFASGKNAIAECDRCGFRYKLKQLKNLVIKTKNVNLLVCPECYEADHPQLQLGMYPIDDPQAIRDPRPDNSYCGTMGSRDIQWGWAPVGLGNPHLPDIINDLLATGSVGSVTVEATIGPTPPGPVPICGTITEGTYYSYGEETRVFYGYSAGFYTFGSISPGTVGEGYAVVSVYDVYTDTYDIDTGTYSYQYSWSVVHVTGVFGATVEVDVNGVVRSVTTNAPTLFYDGPFGFTGAGTMPYCAEVTYTPPPDPVPVPPYFCSERYYYAGSPPSDAVVGYAAAGYVEYDPGATIGTADPTLIDGFTNTGYLVSLYEYFLTDGTYLYTLVQVLRPYNAYGYNTGRIPKNFFSSITVGDAEFNTNSDLIYFLSYGLPDNSAYAAWYHYDAPMGLVPDQCVSNYSIQVPASVTTQGLITPGIYQTATTYFAYGYARSLTTGTSPWYSQVQASAITNATFSTSLGEMRIERVVDYYQIEDPGSGPTVVYTLSEVIISYEAPFEPDTSSYGPEDFLAYFRFAFASPKSYGWADGNQSNYYDSTTGRRCLRWQVVINPPLNVDGFGFKQPAEGQFTDLDYSIRTLA